jgi:alpha-glucosidase
VGSGLAGIWNDMNEPATGSIDPLAMRFDRGRDSHERWHNQYALLMAMGTTEGLRAAMPDRRTFVLSRAGFAGIQRYAANWMGDNLSRWDHLRLSVAMACGLGLSGQPFVGADVGGFMGNANAELCVRWTQYGALTPFFRNHSGIGNVDQYAWSWGVVAESQIRAAIELRYRLLPYLYAAFLESSRTGAPVQRPLVFDHQDDATVLDVDDEYLLGRDLLVAPVMEPGMTARQVYLPEGGWVDWYDDTVHAGERFIIASTPMDRIPLYARAGSVVPMWQEAPASTWGHRPLTLELHVFVPDVDGTHVSEVQEDDGLTLAAASGAFVRTTVRVSLEGDRLTVAATVTGSGFAGFERSGARLVLHGRPPPRTASLDGEALLTEPGRALTVEVPHTRDFTYEAVLS